MDIFSLLLSSNHTLHPCNHHLTFDPPIVLFTLMPRPSSSSSAGIVFITWQDISVLEVVDALLLTNFIKICKKGETEIINYDKVCPTTPWNVSLKLSTQIKNDSEKLIDEMSHRIPNKKRQRNALTSWNQNRICNLNSLQRLFYLYSGYVSMY